MRIIANNNNFINKKYWKKRVGLLKFSESRRLVKAYNGDKFENPFSYASLNPSKICRFSRRYLYSALIDAC